MGLITESKAIPRVKILDTETYASVFGPKQQRKRPRLSQFDYGELLSAVEKETGVYDPANDKNIEVIPDYADARRDDIFEKGHSKRLWGELYKVLDSSDVIVQGMHLFF